MNDVTIQMPAAQRFGFMHKYSADEYSMEMGRAVDMWAECAVLVLCVAEINKLLGKLKVKALCWDMLRCGAVLLEVKIVHLVHVCAVILCDGLCWD
jgi:hypothetical protein